MRSNNTLSLACGSCLLAAGSIADLTSPKIISVAGTFLQGLSILCTGLSQDGYTLIVFRTLQGLAAAMTMPTSVAIMTASFPPGRRRNFGLSCLGTGQPIGFSLGLVFGGLVQNTSAGWRLGFWICGGGTVFLALVNYWVIPAGAGSMGYRAWGRVRREIDWIGVGISCLAMGLSSYCFA
jgi:MFS family permease